MATFPALQPSTRTFTPGRHPHSEIPTLSGLQTRVRTSNVLLDQRLRLTFTALTEAEMLSIRTHYLGQQGRFLSFTIPNELLSGTTTPSSFTPTGYSWIYADRPQIQDIGLQRYTVTLELSTVPPEGATLNGAEFTVAATLAAGAADAELPALGTVTISFTPGAASGGVATDPNFSSVSLLLHMDGSNGSTTFTDNSSNALTVTPTGNAQISTAQSKFGGASGLFDGTGDYLSVPHNAVFSIEASDFTLEAWIYLSASGVTQDILNKRTDSPSASGWGWRVNTTNTLQFFHTGGSSVTSTATIAGNTWVHVAVTRSGSTVRQFINGTVDATTATFTTGTTNTQQLRIGIDHNGGGGFTGYMDDLRITKGVARYTANFSPPTAAFPDS